MRNIFLAVALLMSALIGSLGLPAQAAPAQEGPASPANIKRLDAILAKVKPGDKFVRIDDMLVVVDQIRAFRNRMVGGRSTQLASGENVRYWPGGNVPYVFDNLPASEQAAFLEAAREWEKWIGVKFFPRTNEENYIRVFQDPAAVGYSYSVLGMSGGAQNMSLNAGATKYLTCHEMGHALGFNHEHQRSDRDNYITVLFENVAPGSESQYTLISDTKILTDYDFNSIMHYFDTAFSVDGVKKTMVCKPGYEQFQSTMGDQTQITELDKAGAAIIYGYPLGVTPTPTPLPPRPTLASDAVRVNEGNPDPNDPNKRNTLTFRVGLSYIPTKPVTFSYEIKRYLLPGQTEQDPNLNQYSAIPGQDYTVDSMKGTVTMPAMPVGSTDNTSRVFEIPIQIIPDTTVENDESLTLVLSDPVNVRFANDAPTLSVKGTIVNDDVATATPTPAPTKTPTPRPTPFNPPSARVSLSPVSPAPNGLVTASVVLTPSSPTKASLTWSLNGAVIARDVNILNLARFRGTKRGDVVTLDVTPYNGTVVGKTVTAQVAVANTPPVARGGTLSTLSGAPVSVALAASDYDGDTLTFGISSKPLNGAAGVGLVDGKWTLIYRSKAGFIGTDSFTIIAFDGRARSAPATVQVKVAGNSAPQLVSITPSTGNITSGTTVNFYQTVKDTEKNHALVAFVISNSARSASAGGGLGLVYDMATRTARMTNEDGSLSNPMAINGSISNSRASVLLRSVATDAAGNLTIRWQVTFKAGWTGAKTLWSRVQDTAGLFDGFRAQGTVNLVAPPSTNSAKGTSAAGTGAAISAGNS